jgi:hypothetical protein
MTMACPRSQIIDREKPGGWVPRWMLRPEAKAEEAEPEVVEDSEEREIAPEVPRQDTRKAKIPSGRFNQDPARHRLQARCNREFRRP